MDFDIRESSNGGTQSDRDIEKALRPSHFDSFSGQDKVTELLKVFVQAAKTKTLRTDSCPK